jgi:hypothetical protein
VVVKAATAVVVKAATAVAVKKALRVAVSAPLELKVGRTGVMEVLLLILQTETKDVVDDVEELLLKIMVSLKMRIKIMVVQKVKKALQPRVFKFLGCCF